MGAASLLPVPYKNVAEAYVNNNNNSSSPTTTIIIIASKQTTHTNIAHIYVKGGKERERVAKQRQQKSLQPRNKIKSFQQKNDSHFLTITGGG
jgi:hypothetical protein